jgi:hypothetical protein
MAWLTACGGHTADHGAIEGSPTAREAGGTAATATGGASGTGNAAAGAPTTRTNTGGTHGSAGSATESGGTTNGTGGATSDTGGADNDDGGLARSTGSPLSTPRPQVWVGETQWQVTYTDDALAMVPEHVVLVLNPEGADDAGSTVLGEAAPPPPPTDPDAFYPPVYGVSGILLASTVEASLFEGVPYSLLDVRRTDTRLIFHLNPLELWKDWCKLKTACSPTPDLTLSNHAPDVDDLCTNSPTGVGVCQCDDSTCRWNPTVQYVSTIDVQLRDGVLEGQISQPGGWVAPIGIRLKRVQ